MARNGHSLFCIGEIKFQFVLWRFPYAGFHTFPYISFHSSFWSFLSVISPCESHFYRFLPAASWANEFSQCLYRQSRITRVVVDKRGKSRAAVGGAGRGQPHAVPGPVSALQYFFHRGPPPFARLRKSRVSPCAPAAGSGRSAPGCGYCVARAVDFARYSTSQSVTSVRQRKGARRSCVPTGALAEQGREHGPESVLRVSALNPACLDFGEGIVPE